MALADTPTWLPNWLSEIDWLVLKDWKIMFERLGHFVVRRSKAILAGYVVFLVVAGALGFGVFSAMKTQGYDNPKSDSARVDSILQKDFSAREASVVLIIDSPTNVDDPAAVASATSLLSKVAAEDHVERVDSYWSLGKPASLKSKDGKAALATIYFDNGIDPELASTVAQHIQDTYDGKVGMTTTYVGGMQTIYHAINSRIQSDLARAEAIAIPLNIILLMIIFGTAVSAGLPMIVALSSIFGSFFALFVISQFTDVSVFALNLITGLGMGLGIDYALLIVNRYREELHAGHSVEDSVARTVATAGRTVFFSGIAVMLVLGAMTLFPQYFLKSFAYAGVSVVLFAVIASLTALPASLALLGHKIDKLKIRRSVLTTKEDGAWAWLARSVMKRPLVVIIGAMVMLGAMAAPALSVKFGQVDDRVLPASDRAAIAGQISRDRFDGAQTTPIEILIPRDSANIAQVDALAVKILARPGTVTVASPDLYMTHAGTTAIPNPGSQQTDTYSRLTVVSKFGPRDSESVTLVDSIRSSDLPAGTLVGGASAIYSDSQAGISDHLPAVLMWLSLATLIVLFLYTGSVLLPIKAVFLNLLSLSATLGVIKWVFQDGHLQWLTGKFTVTGVIDTSSLVLVAVVAFGLSMDYEVFMLSRIKEEHDRGANTMDAVSFGLQRSGRIITAAAILIALVFFTFLTSGVTSIKMLGLGTAFAILLDATIVRGLLVPALMRVAGKWNWWAPKPLKAIYNRFGISD